MLYEKLHIPFVGENRVKWGWKGEGGGDNSIIYDKQVTQDFYVIICVDINIVI